MWWSGWAVFHSTAVCCAYHGIGAVRILRIVQQASDIMNEQRVEKIGYLFSVGKFQRTFEWYPAMPCQPYLQKNKMLGREAIPHALEVHRTDFDHVSHLFTLQNAIATTTCHACYVQQLRAVDEVIIYRIQISSLVSRPSELGRHVPSRRATQTPLASTWKHRLPSSSQRVAVTLGFIPGGAT